MHRFVLIAFAIFASLEVCGCSPAPAPARPLSAPVSIYTQTPATCGGVGIGAPPGTMNANALALANLITNYRAQLVIPLPAANAVDVGVAQWHAQDMATHNYVGLVGSDGEDPFRRMVCSGALGGKNTGIIAVGYSTNPQAVFDALISDFSANSLIVYSFGAQWSSIGVGYSNGYWMVILGQ